MNLGFWYPAKGLSQHIKTGAEVKAGYDNCIEEEGRSIEFKRKHEELVEEITKNFTKEIGRPVEELEASWRTKLGMSPGQYKERDLTLEIGLPEKNFLFENIGRYAKRANRNTTEYDAIYVMDGDECQNAHAYSGELTSIGLDPNQLGEALACINSEGKLTRFNVKFKEYDGAFEKLKKQYKIIDKTVVTGDHPHIRWALFIKGDMVIIFTGYYGNPGPKSPAPKGYAWATYMSKSKFLRLQTDKLKAELRMLALHKYKKQLK